ncbi:MAG: A/G-specific adenine glycosylase [Deltaproteobacteria bacterium]|nr:A/G-specific adenine glycosylase [Deltaproteobacteria bacterium]
MKFSESLLRWYDKNKRKLPWRLARPDPYKTWISEIMLQQTRVDAALPYYEKFFKNFPCVEDLAAANVEKVLQLWSGLGYYSRARNLHQAAQQIVKEGMPTTKEGWMNLPGIGDYSSSAIASIAFEERTPVLDGNVHRVLTRLYALKGDPKKGELKKKLARLAQELLPQKRIGDHNQAMMELGALVCLPSAPQCGVCPFQKDCKAFQMKKTDQFPTQQKKIIRKVSWEALLIENRGKFLLAKRNDKRHLQSMWEFPRGKLSGVQLLKMKQLPVVKHSIMDQNISCTPYLYQYQSGKPKPNQQYVAFQWIEPNELENYPTSSLNKKIIRRISSEEHRPRLKSRMPPSAS